MPAGADADPGDGEAGVVFDGADVALGVRRKVGEGGARREVFGPAVKFNVLDVDGGQFNERGRKGHVVVVVVVVARGDFERRQASEHVQFRQTDGVVAVGGVGVAQQRGVEPAAAALAARGGAVLSSDVRQVFAGPLFQRKLRRKRPGPDARGVGLDDADDAVDFRGRHAEARADAAGRRRTRRDVRVRPEVDVQQRSVRAFRENSFAAFQRGTDEGDGVADAAGS
mmetsp:Transcript_29984/g.91798  ORF Transcript_29984/g.91798 Transcript_29984/m.91798 type:complete len:226 (+) Transcript_29984:429-1106(+)